MRFRVIKIYLLEEVGINYNSAINKYYYRVSFIYKECFALIIDIARAY